MTLHSMAKPLRLNVLQASSHMQGQNVKTRYQTKTDLRKREMSECALRTHWPGAAAAAVTTAAVGKSTFAPILFI